MDFSEHQRHFLGAICAHFHNTGEWPMYGTLDRQLRKHRGLLVEEVARQLDGFMYDSMHAPSSGYDPTAHTHLCLSALRVCQTEGICPELSDDLDAFMKVIRVCIERYDADDESAPITAAEVRERFHIADRPLRNAFHLVGAAGLTSTSSPGRAGPEEQADWSFTVFWTIRRYRDVETLDDFLAVRRGHLTPPASVPPAPPSYAPDHPYSLMHPDGLFMVPSSEDATDAVTLLPTSNASDAPQDAASEPTALGAGGEGYEFAVAISFAGPQRDLAERLASLVREAGFKVFYDNFYPDHLWGKDLPTFFDEIYRQKSLYCVPFISKDYVDRMWTTWERRSATTRLMQERGGEYILPIMVEEVEVPGIPSTIGHVSLKQYSIEEIAALLIKKVHERTTLPAAGDIAS